MTNNQQENNLEVSFLGLIDKPSDSIYIGDPCYIGDDFDLSSTDALLDVDGDLGFTVISHSSAGTLPVYIFSGEAGDWGHRIFKKRIVLFPEAEVVSELRAERVSGVGVDSGQMMVIDSENLINHWKKESNEILGFKVWGQAEQTIFPLLKEEFPTVFRVNHGTIKFMTTDNNIAKNFFRRALELAKEANQVIVGSPIHNATYDLACAMTLETELSAGVLPLEGKTGGLLSVSSTGFGDGYYDIVLYTAEVEGHGRVNMYADIVFIHDEDLEELED